MKSVYSITEWRERRYTGDKRPKYKPGDRLRIYSGMHEGRFFEVAKVRFNEDHGQFEYFTTGLPVSALGGRSW